MTNVMSFGAESKLRLPRAYVEVTDNEMEYTDGLGFWGNIWGTISATVVGIGAIGGGICLLLVPEPTGATKAGGIFAIIGGVGSIIGIGAIWA